MIYTLDRVRRAGKVALHLVPVAVLMLVVLVAAGCGGPSSPSISSSSSSSPASPASPSSPTSSGATAEPTIATAAKSPTSSSAMTPQADELTQAGSALMAYFGALNEGRYSDAVPLYGGDYGVLRDWNPNTAPDDYAGLFQGGCRTNGLQCLKVKDVVKVERLLPTEFKLTVEFQNPDGSLFRQGPCCGDSGTAQPTRTQFEYTVVKRGEQFLVQGLPVYTP